MKTINISANSKLAAAILITAIIIVYLLLLGCGKLGQAVQPYLILYAFDEEGELLAEKMSIEKSEKVLGRMVHIGRLSGKDVVLTESGVGMTNAAMTAQKMIDLYHPKGIIFTGIAGAIDSAVQIGDIVVCERWATHDYGYYGAKGFEPMEIDVFPMDSDRMLRMIHFDVDSTMFETTNKLKAESVGLDSIGNRIPELIVGGVGVSGNSFIDQVEKRVWLSENFEALTTDMESAAVAQVCTINRVPFIIFRSASDLAGGSGSESASAEIRQFFKVAADNSANIALRFLELL